MLSTSSSEMAALLALLRFKRQKIKSLILLRFHIRKVCQKHLTKTAKKEEK